MAGGSGRRAGAILAGALMAAAAEVVAAGLLVLQERVLPLGGPRPIPTASLYRAWLAAGAWAWIPLWGASIGWAAAAIGEARGARRTIELLVSVGLAALPLAWKPAVPEPAAAPAAPRGLAAKTLALRRWAFRDDATVARIPSLAGDPDPVVREQVMLALGVNRVVADLQAATPGHPSRYERSPLRMDLRAALERGLVDSAEAVRAEAARALWKAPRAYGPHPAAADTLAAVLDRGLRAGVPERLAWLALDAAGGDPDPELRAAAARFGASVADPELAAAARRALEPRARR